MHTPDASGAWERASLDALNSVKKKVEKEENNPPELIPEYASGTHNTMCTIQKGHISGEGEEM